MNRGVVAAILVAVLVSGAGTARAHDEFRFVGSIVKADAARNRIAVAFKEADGTDETVQIALTPKTTITRDKKAVPKAQLKAGVHVVVDALGDDYDNLEAVEIRIVPPPGKTH